MANPMGAKANYTRSAVDFHNTNNGLAVRERSGAESFGSPFGSFSIAFRFTRRSQHSRRQGEAAGIGPRATKWRGGAALLAAGRQSASICSGGTQRPTRG
ncbi:hypothetical protein KDX01_28945 [Burkholderia vietnamiensis]|uniref:hypothetical protein n=1 Tax=Burkholderia vietnamiensis TaxID=60552 RepID=UPI0012D9A235|nr:hypothetical protein [Burkholderia vietnamiensis]MBR7977128.1 hypothetical protein [Burkholderia vietnamiensis]